MSDPARLLETNLDGTFRRALDAAVADEPPRGEQLRIWQSIALALPSGVLLGATTTAGAAALGGSAVSGAATNGAATAISAAATSTAISAAATAISGVATSTAISGAATAISAAATSTAISAAATSTAIKAAAAGGIAGVGAGAGTIGGGLGLVAAKALAVGLGLGVVVNVTAVTVPELLNVDSAASAHVAPEARLPQQPPNPRPASRGATVPVVAATPGIALPSVDSPSTGNESEVRATSAPASIATPAAPHPALDSATPAGSSNVTRGDERQAEATDTSAASADELRDESRLLTRARQALNASDPALAIQLIADHRQGFPAGRLVQERDALEVQALQRSARYDEARARARAFLVHFPMSPHSEKMRAIAESSANRQ